MTMVSPAHVYVNYHDTVLLALFLAVVVFWKVAPVRTAISSDEILFSQPESSHLGDCPICCLPLPLDPDKSMVQSCCCNTICKGCSVANHIREQEQRLEKSCPFCRKLLAKNNDEAKINYTKRAEANDPLALRQLGKMCFDEGDYGGALEYWTNAAELGDAMAHNDLSIMYLKGEGVEKDEERQIYHAEEAAIAGHPQARYRLGCHEGRNDRCDRGVRHLIIAANLGHDDSLQQLKECYRGGHVSKDDYAAALRAYQAAVEATKSPQRDAAEEYHQKEG